MTRPQPLYALLLPILLLLASCSQQVEKASTPPELLRDQVMLRYLENVRLGDGVPLDLDVSVRWRITDPEQFEKQFTSPQIYDSLILYPRSQQLAGKVSNTFNKVDSVFSTQRERYVEAVRTALQSQAGEEIVSIVEVIVSDLYFPNTYTTSREQTAMKQRELEQIKFQNVIDVEQALANEKKAEAQGKVEIAKAEADGKVSEINAKTEEKRRLNTLAKAKTDAEVIEMRAIAEAKRQTLLAEAELDKKRKQNMIDANRQREFDKAAVEMKREQDKMMIDQEIRLATLYSDNPIYASYLVNKEMASKIEIAVLPTNAGADILGGMFSRRDK